MQGISESEIIFQNKIEFPLPEVAGGEVATEPKNKGSEPTKIFYCVKRNKFLCLYPTKKPTRWIRPPWYWLLYKKCMETKIRKKTSWKGESSIDSLKIRIPFDEVKNRNSHLKQMVATVLTETGEIISESKRNFHLVKNDGYAINFSVGTIPSLHEEFLFLGIHSKLLGRNYFDGLTASGIEEVFSKINSLGIVDIPENSFFDSRVVDVDIKRDFISSDWKVKEFLQDCEKQWQPSNKFGKGVKSWTNENGEYTGTQFNDRKASGVGSGAYQKFYQKFLSTLEPENKEFFELHELNVPRNLWRHEFNLRDAKVLKRYKLNNTLSGIIQTPVECLNDIQSDLLSKIIKEPVKQIKLSSDMSARNKVWIEILISTGLSWNEIERIIETKVLIPSDRSKQKKWFYEFYQLTQNKKKVATTSDELRKFFLSEN